jgi:molecular chaperone GrpE
LILSLLPILNDFVRSLRLGKDQTDYDAFYKGIEMIYGKLAKVLESQGLVPFESVGKPFDVDFHDALLQVPRDDVPPHTVIEEVERGYLLNGRVLRHAKVVVSAPSEAPVDPAKVSGNA